MNFTELEALRKAVKQLIRDVELSNLEHKHRIALDLSRALDSMSADRRRLAIEATRRLHEHETPAKELSRTNEE